jgi:CBS-domain-containing membrane protein
MTCVGDVMTRDVVAVHKDARFKDIVRVLRARRFSAFPVLDDDNRVIGVVSEADLLVRQAIAGSGAGQRLLLRLADGAKATGLTAAQLMTTPAITTRAEAAVADAARMMHAKRVKRLPVVTSDGRLVGVVSRVDLLGEYDRPDADIRSEIIKQVIESEFMLDRFAFAVTVESGVVTLAGPVDSEDVAVSLLAQVRRVAGVVAVRDRLRYPRR